MTDQIVRLGPEYFPRPTSGIPVSGGSIYIGDPDTDPEIPGNQITVNALQENGSTVPISQPILTGGGGVPLYNGSPVTLLVSESYSLKVLDAFDVQVYYVPSVIVTDVVTAATVDYVTDIIGLINVSSPVEDQTHTVLSFFDGLNKGTGDFYWDSAIDKATANGGTVVDPDNIGGFDGTTGTLGTYLAAQGTGVGFGCWIRMLDTASNPMWFGALGDWDGTSGADDYAPIQSTVNYAALHNSHITFPNGIYKSSKAIWLNNPETITLTDVAANYPDHATYPANQGRMRISGTSKIDTSVEVLKASNYTDFVGSMIEFTTTDCGFKVKSGQTDLFAARNMLIEHLSVYCSDISNTGSCLDFDGLHTSKFENLVLMNASINGGSFWLDNTWIIDIDNVYGKFTETIGQSLASGFRARNFETGGARTEFYIGSGAGLINVSNSTMQGFSEGFMVGHKINGGDDAGANGSNVSAINLTSCQSNGCKKGFHIGFGARTCNIENSWVETSTGSLSEYGILLNGGCLSTNIIGGIIWDVGSISESCISVGDGTTSAVSVSIIGTKLTIINNVGIHRQTSSKGLSINNVHFTPDSITTVGIQLDDTSIIDTSIDDAFFSGTWGANTEIPIKRAVRTHIVSDKVYHRNVNITPAINIETLSAVKDLSSLDPMHQVLDPGGVDRAINMPGVAAFTVIGEISFINATGNVGDLVIKGTAATTIGTVSPGSGMTFRHDGTTEWYQV